jgi:low affinity Fe/Cu permease
MRGWFGRFAAATAHAVGTPHAFFVGLVSVLVWAGLGPCFGYSESWQLTINSGTTVVTFLMVFLIQNTQNRDTHLTQSKLEDIARTLKAAGLDVDKLTDDDVRRLRDRIKALE